MFKNFNNFETFSYSRHDGAWPGCSKTTRVKKKIKKKKKKKIKFKLLQDAIAMPAYAATAQAVETITHLNRAMILLGNKQPPQLNLSAGDTIKLKRQIKKWKNGIKKKICLFWPII